MLLAQYCRPVMATAWEAETGRSMFKVSPGLQRLGKRGTRCMPVIPALVGAEGDKRVSELSLEEVKLRGCRV